RRLVTLVVTLILIGASWQLTPPEYQQRYLTVANYAQGDKLDDSNELRLRIWQAGGKMLLDHPVLGVGLGQFPTAFGTKYSGIAHGGWMNPHNLLLQVACETGLIGLFFFGKFIWMIFKSNYSLHKYSGGESDVIQAVATACSATLLGVVA